MAPHRPVPRSGQRRADFRWAAKVRLSVAWCVAGAVAGAGFFLGNVVYIKATRPSPTPIVGSPSVILEAPKNGTQVSESRGFTMTGSVSSLGADALWILDYNGGSNYIIDEPANIALSGKWSAFDGPFGRPPDRLPFLVSVVLVVADPSCNVRLNQLSNAGRYDISNLPSGCKIVAEATVKVSKR